MEKQKDFLIYEYPVVGYLNKNVSGWVKDSKIEYNDDREAGLNGPVCDQAD